MEKYLFKYVAKGFDFSRVSLQCRRASAESSAQQTNEIRTYLECRCVAPNEVAWRLLQFAVHYTDPSVERIHVHMPLDNNVMFTEDDNLEQVLENPMNRVTKLTAWFVANREYPKAAAYTYVEFLEYFTWHGDGKHWASRKNHRPKIGRIAHVGPAQGDVYCLRMLLHIIKGAKSYASLRTVKGHTYPTFQAACQALGLLGDNREWSFAMNDAAHWALPYQLRELFVTLLLFCDIANPFTLFEEHMNSMGEDAHYHITHDRPRIDSSRLSHTEYVRSYVLTELDTLLKNTGHSLEHFHLPQPTTQMASMFINRLLMDEQVYDLDKISVEAAEQLGRLNYSQRHIYDAIVHSVNNNTGHTFFCLWLWWYWKNIPMEHLAEQCKGPREICFGCCLFSHSSTSAARWPHTSFSIQNTIGHT